MSATTLSDQIEHTLLTLQSADSIVRARINVEGKSVFSALTEALHIRQNDTRPLTLLLFSLFSNQVTIRASRSARPIHKISRQFRNILALTGFAVPIDDTPKEQQGSEDADVANL